MGEGDILSATRDFEPVSGDASVSYSLVHPPRMGRYRILRELGQGGFGRVFLAHDEDLGRTVALKVPNADRVRRAETVDAFVKEARILASLDHPHIVPVYDVGRTDDGQVFVVSKYVEGSDLRAVVETGNLSFPEVAALVSAVADALHYAHTRGLVHRDIKPGNILIDACGTPFVADFGLALPEEEFGRGGELAGTLAYMSPEQARGESDTVDGRSDIFSLGIVLYELLTGRRPFRGSSDAEIRQRVIATEPRPPRQIDDTIPVELEQICLKALSKRVADRYTTALDFSEDLKSFLLPVPTRPARWHGGRPASGSDWVVLNREQLESDGFPPVCMACGGPANRLINHTFSYVPEWVQYLYFLGIIPGAIAESLLRKELRVACPYCDKHRNHRAVLQWTVGMGWLVAILLGVLCYLVMRATLGDSSATGTFLHLVGLTVTGLGIIGWVVLIGYLSSTRPHATKITDREIRLQGLAAGFVRAITHPDQAFPTKPATSSLDSG